MDTQSYWKASASLPRFPTPTRNLAVDGEVKHLEVEAETAARLGFDARFVERVPYFERPGIEVDNQARFHPRAYLSSLVRQIDGGGSVVFEHTSVDEVNEDPLSVVA